METYVEPVFKVFLGLLDGSVLPQEATPRNSIAQGIFENSMMVAKNPNMPKVSLLFAACDPGIEKWQIEDIAKFQHSLQDRPLMRLLNHQADIIKELHASDVKSTQEVLCSHREFATKEKLYQGFVNSARIAKIEMQQHCAQAREKHFSEALNDRMCVQSVP